MSAVEKAARDAYAEYQTSLFLSYPVMDFLGTLLQSRLANQPSDDLFDQQILSLLVTGHRNPLAEAKNTPAQSVAGMFMDKYNRGSQGFFGSSTGPDAQFPESLWDLLGGLADQVDPYVPRPLLNMDANIMLQVMGSFLTLKDQVALLQTCKSLHKDIGREVRVNGLLSLVAQGRQDEAEVMIEKDPLLLLARGDVTDGAGRTFRHITALQYAAWAWDARIWTMMLPYFDQINERRAAGEQLRALERNGLGEHGSHFDFQPLLNAYEAYIALPTDGTWSGGVGGQQRLLPDHVIQEYTTRTQSFYPLPDFRVHSGRPSAQVSAHVRDIVTRWRVGGAEALVVGAHRNTCRLADLGGLQLISGTECAGAIHHGKCDRRAMSALWAQRRQDLSDLLARFDITPRPAPESKSPGRRG